VSLIVQPGGLFVEVHSSTSSSAFSQGRSQLRTVARPVARRQQGGLAVRGLFGLGVPELAVIAGVAALVFGPKQLPAIGKSLGKTVKSFQTVSSHFHRH
jgi:sec-independent protein translocase protein TatA